MHISRWISNAWSTGLILSTIWELWICQSSSKPGSFICVKSLRQGNLPEWNILTVSNTPLTLTFYMLYVQHICGCVASQAKTWEVITFPEFIMHLWHPYFTLSNSQSRQSPLNNKKWNTDKSHPLEVFLLVDMKGKLIIPFISIKNCAYITCIQRACTPVSYLSVDSASCSEKHFVRDTVCSLKLLGTQQ